MNTWIKNPQDPADEHDWTQWFAPHTEYRDTRWNIHADGLQFTATPEKIRAHG